MLDLAFIARLDFLAHMRALAQQRVRKRSDPVIPVETAKPTAKVPEDERRAKRGHATQPR